jgi:predicted Rossmann-fold nucleotide-binding protein
VNPALDYTCENFFVRKYLMVKPTKAVVVLAGGIGTIEEAFEVATLKQNSHCQTMPIYFIDQDGMYSSLMQWYEDHVVARGMLKVEEMEALWKVVSVDEVDAMIDEIVAQSLAA